MQIVFIGAGRLATNLAPALLASGHQIVQVFSRTGASAQALAFRVNAEPVTDLAAVSDHADVYIFSVSWRNLRPSVKMLSFFILLAQCQCLFFRT